MLLSLSRVEVEAIVKMSDHISCSFDQLMSMSNITARNSSSFTSLTSLEESLTSYSLKYLDYNLNVNCNSFTKNMHEN